MKPFTIKFQIFQSEITLKRIPDLGRNQILYGNQFAFDFGQISFIPMLYRYIREHHAYPNSVFVGQKTEIHENFKDLDDIQTNKYAELSTLFC